MIRRVSGPLVDIPESGASRIPASAGQRASKRPGEARDQLGARAGKAREASVVDDGRIETPRRVPNKRMRKPMANATATPIVNRRAQVRVTPAMSTPPSPNSCGSV
jgi:hypothetical protein